MNSENDYSQSYEPIDSNFYILEEASDYSSSMLSLSSTNEQPGDLIVNLTKILSLFFVKKSRTHRGNSSVHPKKENLNTFIVRVIKNMFRLFISNKKSKKPSLKIDPKDVIQNIHWNELCNICRENSPLIEEISKTAYANRLNQENLGIEEDANRCERSCNTKFCREFYSNDLIARAYEEVIGIFFSKFLAKKLCKRFGFICCHNGNHSETCTDKWHQLQDFLKYRYLQCFEVPVVPNSIS